MRLLKVYENFKCDSIKGKFEYICNSKIDHNLLRDLKDLSLDMFDSGYSVLIHVYLKHIDNYLCTIKFSHDDDIIKYHHVDSKELGKILKSLCFNKFTYHFFYYDPSKSKIFDDTPEAEEIESIITDMYPDVIIKLNLD